MQLKLTLEKQLEDLKVEHAKLKSVVGAKKLMCNGTFGKLGSPYSALYSPDLMLGVTLSGQLHLASLIYDIEFSPEVKVVSANTDGVTVMYPKKHEDRIRRIIDANAERTGFEYDITGYSCIAMKDVNNYVAVTTSGKVKRKGIYASTGLMKNPTNDVCSKMVCDYLVSGVHPRDSIKNYSDPKDFVAIRNVKGGGIQYDSFEEVDDWVCVNDLGTKDNEWRRPCWEEGKVVKRKSRPAPVQVGVGGQYFGRIARWYMQKDGTMPINYVGSGNKVPKTDGARLCMVLPDALPADIDLDWYVNEAVDMLKDMGVEFDGPEVLTPESTQNIDKTPVTV